MIRNKTTLLRRLKQGAKEVEISRELFDIDLPELNTIRIASGKSKQIGKDEWISDGMEYLIRVVK